MDQSSLEAATTALKAPTDQSLRVPCYCEENVWRLAYRKLHQTKGINNLQYHVVFVSNPNKCVPMFQQRAVNDPSKPCFWDYHVLLFCSAPNAPTFVLDVDSHLPYPCLLEQYLGRSFSELHCPSHYLPYFRVVDADVYIRNFASNRMHMYDSETKEWNAPPPTYDCIQGVEGNNNLDRYMTIDEMDLDSSRQKENRRFGRVYSIEQLRTRFGVV